MTEACDCARIKEVVREVLMEMGYRPGGRSKRKPSAYNLFLGDCIPKKPGPITERFTSCVKEYKETKLKK